MHALHRFLIVRHFTRALPPFLYRAVQHHIRTCGACRAFYTKHLEWEALLPDAEQRTGQRLWRQATASAPASPPPLQGWGLTLAGAAAAAALILVVQWPADPYPPIQARGTSASESHVEMLVRAPAEPRFQAHEGELEVGSELAFRVDNTEGHRYLLLVIVDAERQVHLLYPEANGLPGRRVDRLPPGAALPDAFAPALPPGRFDVVALFTTRPFVVDKLEALLEKHTAGEALRQLSGVGRGQRLRGTARGRPAPEGP